MILTSNFRSQKRNRYVFQRRIAPWNRAIFNKVQSVAVAAVLVSKIFLQSHAYLKDCAVQIRGASVAHPIWSQQKGGLDGTRTTKQVLSQVLDAAGLKPTEIQILEMRPKPNSSLRQAFADFRQTDTKVSSKSLNSFDGSVGLAVLCELGKSSRDCNICRAPLLTPRSSSVAIARLGRPRGGFKSKECAAVHGGPGRCVFCDGSQQVGWEIDSRVERHRASTRRERASGT